MGFTEAGRRYYRDVYLPALGSYVEVVDPWSLNQHAAISEAAAAGRSHFLAIGERNAAAIRSCEMLIADLDGQEVDSGTAAEVGYAAGHGLLCLGLRTDLRMSGEAGLHVNAQVESFIYASGGQVLSSLAGLLALLDELCATVDSATAARTPPA
jgi:nucleoside 2-deoxyribosyltransferase